MADKKPSSGSLNLLAEKEVSIDLDLQGIPVQVLARPGAYTEEVLQQPLNDTLLALVAATDLLAEPGELVALTAENVVQIPAPIRRRLILEVGMSVFPN